MILRSSAPGKAILMGEHAAVYGEPALVAAIDRRAEAEFQPQVGPAVHLRLPALGLVETTDWPSLAAYAAQRREDWVRFASSLEGTGAGATGFAEVRGQDPAHVVKTALGEGILAWGAPSSGGELTLRSDLPVGAGFGSSAACAVALLDLLAQLLEKAPTAQEMIERSLDVERRQHGTPSGIDNATVVHGGWLWVRREAGALVTEKLVLPGAAALASWLRIYHSGDPAESTGAVVAAVRAWRERHPARFAETLASLAAATRSLRALLAQPEPEFQQLCEVFRVFQRGLDTLGVVPPAVREVVAQVEAAGGAAKISGAGSLTGRGAGSLLVLLPPGEPVEPAALSELARLPITLGAEGLRREEGRP